MQGTVQLELPGRVATAGTGAQWRGERFDLSLAYGFSWLLPNTGDHLNVPYAATQDLSLSAFGAQPLLPGMSGEAQGVGLNSQWRLTAESAVQLNAALHQLRLRSGSATPVFDLQQAMLDVGMNYGAFSGNVTGRVNRLNEQPGYPNSYWSGIDVGVSWRTPWRGELTVGARNVVGKSSNEEPTPAERTLSETSALATEIEQTKPAVIGLQEATLWRDQLVSDVVTGTTTPNADHVVYDQVGLLIANLAADGTPYVVASRSTTSDTEGARINPDSPDGYSDIRRTSSDAILVRADQMDRISNPQSGDYLAKSVTVTSTGRRTNERGWVSVDYRLDDTHTVRIISTHLEPAVATPLSVIVQTLQAVELLGRVYASPHPVVVLGDLNSPDNIPLTPAYWILRAGLNDAWWTTHPFNLQGTCCQATLLDNPKSTAVLRLDHVLVRGVTANSATFTGTKPFRLTPPPLWVSDHFGVESTLHVTDTPAWLWLARLVPFLGPLI